MNLLQSSTPVAYLTVSDRGRALGFYRDTLGFVLHSSDDFGDFIEVGGGLLRMTVMADHKAHGHPVFGWNVDDIRAAVEVLRDGGIAFTIYEGMGQDPLGIWTSPDGKTKVAFFADQDGNVLSLSQAAPG
ncbi:VOC family protein [Sphingomonas sp. So64.6b]|uniref:VOC family protein n=1 Tax=Sphingomonas sp. So64.6b TaxID=2997354 RepID=UPI0016020064|nr:VOC family protein [Sphingomonas sp. So64.6b]QNA82874.1 VOC family protein [Sphingomonas sp. So64.6b]